MSRTEHQARVTEFMLRAKQEVPQIPTMPTEKVRLLRAKLILEEALETVAALGVRLNHTNGAGARLMNTNDLTFTADGEADIQEIADGCADISVVTIGTLCACGIHDKEVLEAVDRNNLEKFGPGHTFREDGKLIKPPGHTKVMLMEVIMAQK